MSEGHRPSFLSKVRNLLIGATVVGSGGAAIEATAHPIESLTNTAKTAVVDVADGLKKTGESLVSFYNESAEVRKFNEETAGKLNGSIPLEEGEQIFERVEVVPAGKDLEELKKMQQEGTPVNVRNYPGTYTPDGQFTVIIGKLPQGTIIENAILVKGTVPSPITPNAFGKWFGFIYRPPDSDPNKPGEIGYFYSIFGEPESAVESPPTPITPSE